MVSNRASPLCVTYAYPAILTSTAGVVVQMNKDDILGHEFCGVVESVGPGVKKVKVGQRYVASFQIACGDVSGNST